MEKYNVKSSSQQMPSFLQAIGAVAPRQSSGSNQRSGVNQSSTTTVYHMQGSSRPITSTSLGHHQLLSDSTFQGGKTVHHMGQSNVTKSKIKEPTVVKIEVGLNPTTQKKQRRSSSSGDGPARLGSEATSRDLIFPPVKKIKLEIGDAGIWETKKESEASLVSGIVGSKDGINYDEYDDDLCPVDYKSRCVILLEEQMQNIVQNFKASAMELYYLENDGDILDYSNWLKKPNPHLGDFLDKTATKYDMSIRGIESEEARIFTSGSGTLPTITPVAISKKLPPAIAALQQKQMESSGGIPLSTTAATTTIGSPTPLNTSCNENASSSSKTTSVVTSALGLGSNHGILVRPIPIVAVPSSSAGLLADPVLPSHSLVQLDSAVVVTAASVVTTSVIGSTRLTSPFHGTNHVQSTQEATVELAKQEAKVLSRVADLRKQGLWTLNRLPKILEPERSKSHWDMLLKEMEWMAVDFAQERRWKIACSATISCSVIRSEAITKRNARRRREEKRKIDMASYMARVVEEFWLASQEDYLFKNYHDMEKDCKQVLENILTTTSKVYLESERNLISNIDPNLCHAASESDESDDREQEIKDLLSSAEWPIDNVFKQFYPKMFTEGDRIHFGDANCQAKSYEGCNVGTYESSRDDGAAGDFEHLHYSDPSLSDTNLDLFKGELEELQSVGPGKELIEANRTVKKYASLDEFLSDVPIINNDEVIDLLHNGLFCGVTSLRPYQVSSAARLSKFWLQGIPFLEIRDPGLGTKLLLAFHFSTLAFNYQEWGCHLIVIKEKKDLFSWRASFAKFAPSLKVKVAVDLKEGFDNFFNNSSIEDAAKNFNVLVTCYDHFRQNFMIYEKFKWKTLVLDKVADLCSRNINFNKFSYLSHNHLVMFFDAEAVPSEAFMLLPQDGKDSDDGKMDCSTILSEPFVELIEFILKENIFVFIDNSEKNDSNWREEPTSQIASKNISAIRFTMDEAASVFRLLCSSIAKKKVINQLQTLNILTLASTLPAKQALTYNEGFGALLEESPEVTSPEFLHQVNELYNTCAHLDVVHLLTEQSSCLKDSMNSFFFPSLLDIGNGKVKDHSLPTSLKHLLTLYSWGVGLIEETTDRNPIVNNMFPNSNAGETFEWKSSRPYSPNLLRSLTNLVSDHQGDSYYDRFDSVKKMMDKIDNDKLLDVLPREIDRSLRNIVFLMRPLKTNFDRKDFDNQTFDSTGSMGMIKEEMMDYSYEDGNQAMDGIDARGLDSGEVFDALGSDCLKELTSIGKRCFEEELHKFLISFKMVICQILDVSSKRLSCSGAKKLIVPLIDTIDKSTEEITRKNIDHVDRKIIGCNKGKLSSFSMLLEKERQMSEGRFVMLTCHNQTLSSIQCFLSRRGFTYVSIDSNANISLVRKIISKFNFNKKYDCLLIQHLDASTWQSFVRALGPDALPMARNLIVLDEELLDIKKTSGVLLWQLLAKRMSAFNDLNLVRLYHKNTIEGYQVHRRWSKQAVDNLFGNGKFDCQLGTFQQIESSTDSFQIFKGKDLADEDVDYVGMDDEDIDDLDFIYSSHQDGIRISHDEVLPQLCSCLDEPLFASDDINEEEEEILRQKQNEVRSYAMEVIGRQLKCSETLLKSNQPSCFKTDKLIQVDWDNEVDYDISLSEVQPYEDLLTYEVDYMEPECFISDLTGEKMPVWAPPIPPQDDDVFLDRNVLMLYESIPMSETQLPSLYVRKGNKRSKIDDSYARSAKTLGRDAKHDSSSPNLQRPRSLFERPTAISQPNTIPLSTASSLAYGFQIDRDGRLINKAGIPVGQPYARSPTVPIPMPRPNPESQGDQVDWLVHEEWALLQAYQMTCQEGNPLQDSLNQPPPQSRLPNWELIACIVNGFGRVFRSARQCRLRYENVILPREEGRSHFDNGQRKFKKTSKGLYKTKSNRQLKTIQMYSQDGNRSLLTHLSLRFDLLKNFLGKKHLRKIAAATAAQAGKTNHVAFMLEHNISYDRPLSPTAIAEMKLERVNKEKEKRTVTALPDRLQQTLPTTAPSSNPVNAVLNVQQQQPQQPPSEAVAAAVTPISTSLTVPLGAQVSFVLPNSQLRMAVPGIASNQQQQQQQVILQAAVAQQQMAIVASAASNSMLGKVPLVSGVSNSIPAVRNLTNLSFVVNQSAAANQQSTTFVTVSKAQGTVVSTVGIVTSLSPAAIKAIRNINPAAVSQLASSINIGQNKAMPSATAVSFPPGIIQNNRIAIRGPGTIQLNQRLTQKPSTSQQQVTLTAGTNMAGIQKLSSVGVVSVPTTQTFHVKNPQVVLKSKPQPTGVPQQQLSGATVVSRLAAATSNQGPSLQFQHLQIQSKTPLLEVMQQQQMQGSSSSAQQILTTNFTSAAVSGMNVTTLIKSVSANSNLGKVVTPTQTAIRQSQVAKRPTVTAINIQGQGNRTALLGIQQVTKGAGSSQVIYQQPKLVLQPQGVVKQQPGVQLQQGSAILAMTSRGNTVNISAIGISSTIATGNGMAIPINQTCLAQGVMGSGQPVRVAKQMINAAKVTPLVQHITVRASQQQQQLSQLSAAITSAVSTSSSTTSVPIIRPQNPTSSS